MIVKRDLISLYYLVVNNYLVNLVAAFFLIILASYVFYRVYLKIQEIKERNRKIEEERKKVKEFLELDLRKLGHEELKLKLDEFSGKNFLRKYPKLKSKIKESKEYLFELRHGEELNRLIDEKNSIKEEINKLVLEKEKLKRTKDQQKIFLKNKLNLYENSVFDKAELSEEEIGVLLEEGFKQVNEYCVAKKRVITVLIKPILNHSVAHTFLVWSVGQLLEEYDMIERIVEHETRDADLTFEIEGKEFAIEIETGTLLRKKKQFEEKIKFLNETYKNRWMIVVSKRDLVKKYKKFGMCTQRRWMREKLEKMAGI
ncbi:MAG: hypothetical protein ABH864_03630 [archaeon]